MHGEARTTATAERSSRQSVAELELAAPLADAHFPGPSATSPGPMLVLVRLHSIPLGLVRMAQPEIARDRAALARVIEEELGGRVREHLDRDGLAATPGLPPGGLPWPSDVGCLAHRRAVLTSGPPVTVVMPVADRPDLLRASLRDVAAQSYPEYTVVVVDNAPDRSGAAAAVHDHNASAERQVRYVEERRPGSSRARNRGLAVSTTPITAFVDADVRIDPHWLAELVSPLVEDERTGCSTGLILPAEIVEPGQELMFEWGGYDQGFERRRFQLGVPADGAPLHPYQPGVFGSGQSMAFRTDLLRDLGGFDLALGVRTHSQGGEDQAAMLDVVLEGWALVYTPAAIVWHPDPAEVGSVLRKLNSYGVGLTALLTRTVVRRPRSALEIAARLPAALGYFFTSGSNRNRRHSDRFPRAAVWSAELRGMAWGPLGYALSVAAVPRRRRRTQSHSVRKTGRAIDS